SFTNLTSVEINLTSQQDVSQRTLGERKTHSWREKSEKPGDRESGKMPIHLPVFIITTWLLAMLPGAGQALILRQTIVGGRSLAWASIAGTCTGLLLWSTAAAAGLSATLLANRTAYAIVRLAGGFVLFALGVSTLTLLRKPAPIASTSAGHASSSWRGYVVGLTTNLGNPKAGIFA